VDVKKVVLIIGFLLALPVHADVAGTGEAIAAALNQRDIDAILRTIDVEAVTRHVIKDLGLSAADRQTVHKVFPKALRTNVTIGMRSIETSKGSARFLRSGMRGARPYALVRYDLGDNGIDYVEYYLNPSDKVEDWYVHSMAAPFSSTARLGLATVLKTDSMLYGMFGTGFTTQSDAKPFTDLRAQLQAQDFPAAYRTLERFPEEFRKTRQWAVMRVTYGARTDEAAHRSALGYLAQNFGKDPELQFMLIDHYFFQGEHDRALAALSALERAIGGEDGATANLRGLLLISAKRFQEAGKACRRGMEIESDHKPAYWCLVNVGVASRSGKIAIDGLKAYERAFAVEFNLDELAALAEYKQIAATPEFAAWRKSRR
jgi:tetratricopeptide (TPR) repeat protein